MQRTWLLEGLSNDFGSRLIQNLLKKKKGFSGGVQLKPSPLLLGHGAGRIDVAINVLK